MLLPAWVALQSALIALLIVVAVAGAAAFIWMGWIGKGHRSGKAAPGARPTKGLAAASSVTDPPDLGDYLGDDNGDDSDFAAAATAQPPRHAPQAAAHQRPQQPLAADLLLVDDSAVARAKLRRLFESAGYQVQLARDGVEALELLQKGRYQLMVTDLEMPRLDGVALIATCQGQAHTAAMPILAITGHDDLQARLNDCQEICGIYRKPWIDEDLASHVALLLVKPPVRPAETVES